MFNHQYGTKPFSLWHLLWAFELIIEYNYGLKAHYIQQIQLRTYSVRLA
jgi:hypothetical protein